MHAVLQMSAGGPYSAPIRTSRALYCLVWMSSVKCLYWGEKQTDGLELGRFFTPTPQRKIKGGGRRLTTQQAFPRSAIFTFSLWALPGSSGLRMNSEALKAEREGERGSD